MIDFAPDGLPTSSKARLVVVDDDSRCGMLMPDSMSVFRPDWAKEAESRAEKISRIKAEIASGEYLTEAKLDWAMERMLDEVA